MGRYSDTYTYKQMIKMGFIKASQISKEYKTKTAEYWFAYYGEAYVDEVAEVHARTSSNVGSPLTVISFNCKDTGARKKLFIKSMNLGY